MLTRKQIMKQIQRVYKVLDMPNKPSIDVLDQFSTQMLLDHLLMLYKLHMDTYFKTQYNRSSNMNN
jgi:hypothetical protein